MGIAACTLERMDDWTLAELIHDFGGPLRYVSKLTSHDTQLAEDVVQETIVRAWQRQAL